MNLKNKKMLKRTGVWEKHSHDDTLKFMKAYAHHLKMKTEEYNIIGFEKRIEYVSNFDDPMKMRNELEIISKEINRLEI